MAPTVLSQSARPRNKAPCAAIGICLAAALGIKCCPVAMVAPLDHVTSVPRSPTRGMAEDSHELTFPFAFGSDISLEGKANLDPLGFLSDAHQYYRISIRDYRCTFLKRERLGGSLRPPETTTVMFKESPYSVMMSWPKSPRPARRVLYVEGKWHDKEGRALAQVQPEPVLAMLFPRMMRPIDDWIARTRSRRRIDQFGFGRTLERIIEYCEMAKIEGMLEFAYEGPSIVGNRRAMEFVRRLPYTGPDGKYPDRVLRLHLDQEWLLPIAVFTYADDDENRLLSSYVYEDIELNVGLSDADFTLDTETIHSPRNDKPSPSSASGSGP